MKIESTLTARIDHAAEARWHIVAAHGQQDEDGCWEDSVRDYALIAQAEATLALVEQQRIANLIALAEARHAVLRLQVASDAAGTLTVYREHDEERLGGWHELDPDIAAALGIETGADDA